MYAQLCNLSSPYGDFFSVPQHRQLIEIGVGIAAVGLAWKTYSAYRTSEHRRKWAAVGKDVVVLHQFQRAKYAPSVSPFPLKLETYLRMAEIPYINDFEALIGPKEECPWITLNNVDTSDSQICIEMLASKFHKDFSSHLTEEEKAVSRALLIVAEEHLYWWGLLWRWAYTKGKAVTQVLPRMSLLFKFMLPFLAESMQTMLGLKAWAGTHKLKSLKWLLKISKPCQKQFFMGEIPTELDCALFGLLAQCVWNMPESPIEQLISTEFINLKSFCERMKEKFWPDWDDCLAKES